MTSGFLRLSADSSSLFSKGEHTPSWWLALALGLAATGSLFGCSDGGDSGETRLVTGPTMQPGVNCWSCHGSPASEYPDAPEWTVAGTVFEGPESDQGAEGVTVRVTDVEGGTYEMLTNEVGNFYTFVRFPSPYWVTLEKDGVSVTMPGPPPAGGCNACHSLPTVGGAPGRLYLPADGTYDSEARCEDDVLVVENTRYPCAPFACAPETDERAATCVME